MDDEFFPTTIATTRRELMLNTSTEGLGSNGSSHSSVLIHIMFFTLVITQLITLLMSASTWRKLLATTPYRTANHSTVTTLQVLGFKVFLLMIIPVQPHASLSSNLCLHLLTHSGSCVRVSVCGAKVPVQSCSYTHRVCLAVIACARAGSIYS